MRSLMVTKITMNTIKKISPQGQIQIPKKIMQPLKIKPSDYVESCEPYPHFYKNFSLTLIENHIFSN